MNLFFVAVLVFSFSILNCSAKRNHDQDDPKLPIALYYESLCPYCMEFMTSQLNPSMVRKDRMHFTDLALVPYGHATVSDDGNITCQHGVAECELNAWHGCILENNNITDSLKLIACMMRGRKNNLDKCAKRYNIDVTVVKDCKHSRSVSEILQKYGEMTAKVPFNGVPAIVVDNVFDEEDQENLSNDFDDIFCAKYEAKFNKKLENCHKHSKTKIVE